MDPEYSSFRTYERWLNRALTLDDAAKDVVDILEGL